MRAIPNRIVKKLGNVEQMPLACDLYEMESFNVNLSDLPF